MMANILFANEELNKWCGTKGINYHSGIKALGNLFKYAVPKLPYVDLLKNTSGYHCVVMWGNELFDDGETHNDPAQALFWAIYKEMIDGDKRA